MTFRRSAATAGAMEALGQRLARASAPGLTVGLHGELGSGKTTLVRGYLRGLGHRGPVKSPTFTLVESYRLGARTVHHFDLYRIAAGVELEFIGIDEYFDGGADCLIEWAERGAGALPPLDLDIELRIEGDRRSVHLEARTPVGTELLSRFDCLFNS